MAGWSLHLDGWGDLWDGIGSGKSGEKMREIMKDSRVGSYGVTALIIAFGLWTGLLLSLGQHQEAAALMVAGGVGRFGTCVAAFYGNYPWPEGMAKGWVDGFDGYELFTALVCTLVLLPFAPFEWLLSLILVSLFALCTAGEPVYAPAAGAVAALHSTARHDRSVAADRHSAAASGVALPLNDLVAGTPRGAFPDPAYPAGGQEDRSRRTARRCAQNPSGGTARRWQGQRGPHRVSR